MQVMVDSADKAKEAVRLGKAWAAVHFPANFTANIFAKINDGQYASNETLVGSEIEVWQDNSSKNEIRGSRWSRKLSMSW